MIRRWLAGAAAILIALTVLSVTHTASAQVIGDWAWNCATGATTSATVSADRQLITMTGTITPCGEPPLGNSYGWIVYGMTGEAILYPYFESETLTAIFAYRVGYGSSAVCLAYSPTQSGRLGCFGVNVAADGTVTAPPIPTNDPRVAGKMVVIGPIDTTDPPNCATCV